MSYYVLFFALEESKEEFETSLLSYLLHKKYGKRLSSLDLKSQFTTTFSAEDLKLIKTLKDEFDFYMSHIEVIDYIDNPTGIFKHIMNYALENGTHYYKHKSTKEVSTVNSKDNYYYKYEPHNPEAYVTVIVDHVSLLRPEKNSDTGQAMSLHQTMSKWSADYSRKMITKKLNYCSVDVQQFNADAETVDPKWTDGLRPSLDKLANNKETSRDKVLVIGLFAPARYKLTKWEGIDLEPIYNKYGLDSFRSMYILKNRIGQANVHVPFRFDGAVDYFEELKK